MTARRRPEPPEVKIVHPTYQPSKMELAMDMRVDANFEEAYRRSRDR